MNEMLTLIKERYSARAPFDRQHPIAKSELRQILEAARWAPTAHNLQNFEIVVVDDQELLDKIGTIQFQPSEAFLRENFQLLAFSEEELRQKKVGILGTMVPESVRDHARLEKAAHASEAIPLHRLMPGCPVLLILLYDATKRAPASEGDVLAMISLGCVLENMWLMAHSLGLGLQVMDVFSMPSVEPGVKSLLALPPDMKMAIAARLGYPTAAPGHYLRVRREVEEFTQQNRFGNKGLDERRDPLRGFFREGEESLVNRETYQLPPQEGFVLTYFLTVADVKRSAELYQRVFNGTVLREGSPTIIQLANSWLILNIGGGPTDDKPEVTLHPPHNTNEASSFLNIRVADIWACSEEWRSRGALFLTEPKDHGREIRCYLCDPDGYLIEVGQSVTPING